MRKHRHLLVFLAAALLLGAATPRQSHADKRRKIRPPMIGVRIGPGPMIGVGVAPAPPGGMGMTYPPMTGMGMGPTPTGGMGVTYPPMTGTGMGPAPTGGMGMTYPPMTGMGTGPAPTGGMGMTYPPMTGTGTAPGPMGVTPTINTPIMGRWVEAAGRLTITFLPAERYDNGALCGTFFVGVRRGQYAIRGGSPNATLTFIVGSHMMNVNVTFTNLNIMTWYYGGEKLVFYKAG
jgi:hypothetical protein